MAYSIDLLIMTVTVRTAASSLAHSRATKTAIVFVAFMLFMSVVLLAGRPAEAGVLRTLFGVAALLPALGIVASIVSLAVVYRKRRQPVLIIDTHVRIPHSGVRFPLADLAELHIFRNGARSYAELIPQHLVGTTEDRSPYTIEFPAFPEPQPFELAEILTARVPGLLVSK